MKTAGFYDLVITRTQARFCGQHFAISVGFGGIGDKGGEGDGITPKGRYRLLSVKYRADKLYPPQVAGARVAPIYRDDIWIDDARSDDYNRGLRCCKPAYSHERLYRPDRLYDIIGVLDFNMAETPEKPCPGAGSAIFLHVWRSPSHPTMGCVGFARPDLYWIFQNWQRQSRVVIND